MRTSRLGHGGSNASLKNISRIRTLVTNGEIEVTTRFLKEGERLDHIASELYGDAKLWWVIAAASNIGWWLQAPPGTVLIIPTEVESIGGILT